MTPHVARGLIAAVGRLARAELALHALALSSQRPARQPGQVDDAAGLLDDLGTSIGNAMGNLASALRNLQPPQRLPALRPIRAALRATKPSPDAALVGVTDLLVDAVDTLSNIVRASIQE